MSAVNDYNTHINNNNNFFFMIINIINNTILILLQPHPCCQSGHMLMHHFLIHTEMISSYLTLMADKNSFKFAFPVKH